jgi:hypothetical protein
MQDSGGVSAKINCSTQIQNLFRNRFDPRYLFLIIRNIAKDDLMDILAQNPGTLEVRLIDYQIKMIFIILTRTDKGFVLYI